LLELLSKLLHFTVANPPGSDSGARYAAIPKKDAATWSAALDETRAHRTAPVLGYMLRSTGMDRMVPAPYDTAFGNDYRQTLAANTLLMHTLGQLMPALAEAGVRPIVLKGALLADVYYPDLGTRPMGDIDLLFRAEESPAAHQVFRAMGFAPRSENNSNDAIVFCNSRGITCDVHHRFNLFPPEMRDEITEEEAMPSLAGQPVKCWEPNAQLVHLLVHLCGHRRKSGLIIGWLLDLAFVVRRDGARLCPKRLESLIPHPTQLKMLWRTLGFLRAHTGLIIPEPLQGSVDSEPPLRLPGILRDQRLAQWGLPSVRGWLRLLASHLHLSTAPVAKYPSVSDLAQCLLPSGRD
jgi:hypothetical protein